MPDNNVINNLKDKFKGKTPQQIMNTFKDKLEARRPINVAKKELAASDYKAIKFAEGALTEAEFAPIRAKRKELRETINKLEKEFAEKYPAGTEE